MKYSKLNSRHNRLNKNLSKRQRLAKVKYLRIRLKDYMKRDLYPHRLLLLSSYENMIKELKAR